MDPTYDQVWAEIQEQTSRKKEKEKRFNVNFEVWLINATKRETKWACETHNTTLLPKFQKMVSKSQSENQPKDY